MGKFTCDKLYNAIFNPEHYYDHERAVHKAIMGQVNMTPVDFKKEWRSNPWKDDNDQECVTYYKELGRSLEIRIIYDSSNLTYELYLESPDDTLYTSPLYHDEEDPLLWATYWYFVDKVKEHN